MEVSHTNKATYGDDRERESVDEVTSSSGSETETSTGSEHSIHSVWDSTVNPSEITDTDDYLWICCKPLKRDVDQSDPLGKWLVFRSYAEIDKTWHMIRREVEDGVLSSTTRYAKVAVMFYDPSCCGPGPNTNSLICVHTSEYNVDGAGFALIQLLKHDIKYKIDLEYDHTRESGKKSVPFKTLYWNGGNPSFTLDREVGMCPGPKCKGIKDEWHLNYVVAPNSVMRKSTVHGRWVIEAEHDWGRGLTIIWHSLKKMIKEGVLGPVEMVCPPKLNYRDRAEKPVLLVYTARENKELVGRELSCVVPKDVKYELGRSAYRGTQPFYNHRIEWNDGDPVYVMTRVRK